MTPSARIAAAIEILDSALAGGAVERALTTWARGSRFAGSKDRAAVRDHVYDALRHRRSFLARAGQSIPSGRALMIGACLARGDDPDAAFDGVGHAPAPLSPDERQAIPDPAVAQPEAVALDCPDWLEAPLRASLGADFAAVLRRMQDRAPVFLRVNVARIDRAGAAAALQAEGIGTRPHPLAATALQVTSGASAIRSSRCYLDGLVELQDAAGQAICAAIPLSAGARVLDYCAGGGGKTLALAGRVPDARFSLHDALPQRMRDAPERARRAGVTVEILSSPPRKAGAFDLVVTDVPCSGSGTWARDPEAKWTLTPDRLDALLETQASILCEAAALVSPGGHLAYVTCSLLAVENSCQIDRFLSRHPAFHLVETRRLTPMEGADGFYLALLTRV